MPDHQNTPVCIRDTLLITMKVLRAATRSGKVVPAQKRGTARAACALIAWRETGVASRYREIFAQQDSSAVNNEAKLQRRIVVKYKN